MSWIEPENISISCHMTYGAFYIYLGLLMTSFPLIKIDFHDNINHIVVFFFLKKLLNVSYFHLNQELTN